MKHFATTFMLACLFSALAAQDQPAFLSDYQAKWVENTLQGMTTDEKIGQLLMPRGNYSGKGYDPQKLVKWVTEYHLGGIVFFAGQPTVQAQITNQLQAISKVPLFIGEDFEWGTAMRLDSTVRFPYQIALGAMPADKVVLVERMGQEIGRHCKRLGVHINYAPVVDVNNNPLNPVINFRSFGEDKNDVTQKGLAYMRGLQSQKIISTAKHFPGHGDTGVDSHHDLPVIKHDKQHLLGTELFPYKTLINNGLSGVMTSHLSVPALDPTEHLAATMSSKIITDLLRGELGFKGLVFTDAMDMEGAIKYFPKGEAIVRAILAGNDIIETFEDVPTGFNAVKDAYQQGRLTEKLLNERVRKILMAKSWVGLDHYQPIKIENLVQDLNTIESDLLNRQMAEASITLLKNRGNVLPIQDLTQKIAIVCIDANEKTDFQKMADNYTQIEHFLIPQSASDSVIQAIVGQTQNHDLILIGLNLQSIRPAAKYGITNSNIKALSALTKSGKSILTVFGNPYALDSLGKVAGIANANAIVMAYQWSRYTQDIAAQAIFGALPMQGHLPVTVNKDYPLGMGIPTKSIGRLAYSIPEMVGMDSRTLAMRIDSVVNLGLREKAYPGAVVQVAKDGRVIFQKNYGFHTYEDALKAGGKAAGGPNLEVRATGNKNDVMDEKVKTQTLQTPTANIAKQDNGQVKMDDLYDLASITKISTSALAVMQLMSAGKFDLDKTFGDYYPDFKQSNKGNLHYRDLLTHQAGLKAWIPFWMNCIDSVATVRNSRAFEEKYAQKLKPTFFQRLFGGKNAANNKIANAIRTDKQLWKDCLNAQSITWLPGIFSKKQSAEYPIQMADGMWLSKNYRPTLFQAIKDSPLKPDQGYVYSDLHYYTYPDMVARVTGMDWETYLKKTYRAIGANTLTYNPLRFFPKEKIAPTEYDSLFRKTLIHGRVHDEGAALLGGVSGHAGLFGNANDLTKLMQLYLQKGYYGGQQYIQPEVVDACTKYQFAPKNRRGIAFDKLEFDKKITNGPQSGTAESYGHSGFTGTFTWVDPKYQMVYVFLSNRVYPTRENGKIGALNIRTDVGEAIYKTMRE